MKNHKKELRMNQNIIWTGRDKNGNTYFTWNVNDLKSFDRAFFLDIIQSIEDRNYVCHDKDFEISRSTFATLQNDSKERDLLWKYIEFLKFSYRGSSIQLNLYRETDSFYYKLASKFLQLKDVKINLND